MIPADVKEVFVHTVAHRLLLTPKAESQGKTPETVLGYLLTQVSAPKLR